MRALVQRVTRASVEVGGQQIAAIGPGLLVLLGVAHSDDDATGVRMAAKLRALRVFEDGQGRMNEALGDREVLCVSQFTLLADTARGNRPGLAAAAPAELARRLYERVCDDLDAQRGAFGEHMAVELVNDGPVTLVVEVPPCGATA
ncbi:MAG TPA: D-aminoacyl-tRNA deacylase [Solirubrobacteraceae bacterium]|nr:D-aminoacyl-tRNA deacylase [Solirubrobacteraceae bacterium]